MMGELSNNLSCIQYVASEYGMHLNMENIFFPIFHSLQFKPSSYLWKSESEK